jgi:K+-sensing histidine kinase KdpD
MRTVRRPWVLFGALLGPPTVCLVLAAFRDHVTDATAVLVLVLIVVAAASTGDRWAGLLAALSSAVWFDFFFTQPYNTFSIGAGNDVVVTLLLLVIGTAVTELALWGRREQQRAGARAGYLSGVQRIADAVALHHEDPDKLRLFVAEQIKDVLGVSGCRFSPGPGHDPRNAVLQRDGTVVRNGHPVDVDRAGMPADEETALPVMGDSGAVGNFILSSPSAITRPTIEQRRVAVLLAEQVGRLGTPAK